MYTLCVYRWDRGVKRWRLEAPPIRMKDYGTAIQRESGFTRLSDDTPYRLVTLTSDLLGTRSHTIVRKRRRLIRWGNAMLIQSIDRHSKSTAPVGDMIPMIVNKRKAVMREAFNAS